MWYFLFLVINSSYQTTVIGPFGTQKICEAWRIDVVAHFAGSWRHVDSTNCWYSGDRPS